jgi:hypothetical protein
MTTYAGYVIQELRTAGQPAGVLAQGLQSAIQAISNSELPDNDTI